MNGSAIQGPSMSSRNATGILSAMIGVLILLGLALAGSAEQMLAYLIVLFAAVLPSVLWIWMGSPGIPILPAVSSAFIVYFGFPILTAIESSLSYTPWEITRAALTVALFLLTATAAWRVVAGRARQKHAFSEDRHQQAQTVRLIFIGLAIGVVFYGSVLSGLLGDIGSYFGLVRSVSLTLVVVTCFLIGVARAQGVLRGAQWGLSVAGLVLIILLSWSSLFLVGGMIFALAAGLGYVIVTKRIPWLAVGLIVAVVTVLHAGKAEMRNKYWDSGTTSISSVAELPGLATEWVGEGLAAIAAGEVGQSVLDRASLLQMLLLVESETPDNVDFLFGETYALLPAILVPRFIEADKPASQVGMDLLNIRYGLLTAEGTATTAIGWGLVAEAYANFGYLGVIGMALLVGVCCGALAIWGANAEIVSLPTLVSISVMMGLLALEVDFIQLASSLLQSFASILLFLAVYRWYAMPQSEKLVSGPRIDW